MWKDSKRIKKKRKTTETESATAEKQDNEKVKKEEKKDEIPNNLFNETVRYLVVSSYISAITKLYSWQSEGREEPLLPLWGAKLAAILETIRRNEKRIRQVNFTD